MTAKTTIPIYDSGATPESPGTPAAALRTFVPGEVETGNVHTFYETTTGSTPATRSKLMLSLTPSKDIVRFKYSLATPKSQTIDGLVQAAHVTRVNLEILCPVNGSKDDRVDARSLLSNSLANADIAAMIDKLENLW